jgi:hypothetical protein
MTQVYFLVRGKDNVVKEWIKHLSVKWFPYSYNGQNGLLEGILRPVQLYEFAFPEEHKDAVLNTIFDGQEDFGKHQSNWKGNIGLKSLQKMLGCKPIPKFKKDLKLPMPDRNGMSVMGVGIRDDKMNHHPATGKPNEGI